MYKRKQSVAAISPDPTNTYTTQSDKILSNIFESADKPIFVNEPIGNNTIMYWPSGNKTMVVIFSNVCKQISTGIPSINITLFAPLDEVDEQEDATVTTAPGSQENKDEILDEYLKWSKYMLKTEVVPPVCPSCPSCNSGGLCTDCGGKGGCGTKSKDGKSLADGNNIEDVKGPSSAIASVGKSASGAITGTVDAAGNVVSGTIDKASNLVGGTIGTAADLLKSTGSGLSGLLSGDVRRVGYNQSYNGYNRNNTGITPGQAPSDTKAKIGMVDSMPIDIYSYNGALQSKGSDFRPLTASFGAFSK